jgi:predicted HicB family RNase H-like nuclease
MNETLSHKGYTGSVEVSIEDCCLHGKILFIEDIITYEGNAVEEIKSSFIEAVDRYLSYCDETGKPANKPYSGTFNVRIGSDIHRKAAQEAFRRGITLNDFVAQCIKNGVEENGATKIEQHTHHHHNVVIVDKQEAETMFASMEQPQWRETYVH